MDPNEFLPTTSWGSSYFVDLEEQDAESSPPVLAWTDDEQEAA